MLLRIFWRTNIALLVTFAKWDHFNKSSLSKHQPPHLQCSGESFHAVAQFLSVPEVATCWCKGKGGYLPLLKVFKRIHLLQGFVYIKRKRQGQEWGESNFPLVFLSVCGAGCVFHGVLALCKSALICCKRAEVFKLATYFTFGLLYLALKTCSCNSHDSPHQTTPVHLQSIYLYP